MDDTCKFWCWLLHWVLENREGHAHWGMITNNGVKFLFSSFITSGCNNIIMFSYWCLIVGSLHYLLLQWLEVWVKVEWISLFFSQSSKLIHCLHLDSSLLTSVQETHTHTLTKFHVLLSYIIAPSGVPIIFTLMNLEIWVAWG